jgi:short-chain fatty acids transporter
MTSKNYLNLIQQFGNKLTNKAERWIPDSLIIVWILTFLTFALAIFGAPASPAQAVTAWGRGFWELLPTSMQICLMLMTGYVVARAPIFSRVLGYLASIPSPEKPAHAVALLSLFSMATACIHWGVSLMASSMLAVLLVRRVAKVDYRLLTAAAYLGLGCTWHAGLTGTAPLWANTPANPLMKNNVLNYLIPQTRTIFTVFNIGLLIVIVAAVTALMYLLHPPEKSTHRITPEQLKLLGDFSSLSAPTDGSPSSRMIRWPGFNLLIVALGVVWFIYQTRAVANVSQLFTFDNTNFIFLMLGIGLHYRPVFFIKAIEEAGRSVWGIIIQFPFYAGIFGLFTYTNLGQTIAHWFVAIATPRTFPLITYWYTGILNYFVPSGGSEWLITSPYLVPASHQIGVPVERLIIAYAWGNMMTDMIQPFYAIPLLSVTKLQFREIMGYLLMVFFLYFVITSVAFLIWP